MWLEFLTLPAIIMVSLTALLLLVSPRWHISIAALAIQYGGVFLLVALHWPLEMAITKLLAGWMSGAVLGMALLSLPSARAENLQEPSPRARALSPEDWMPSPALLSGRFFRLLAASLVGLIVVSAAPNLAGWAVAIDLPTAWGGLILIGLGLLHLGFTARPFRTVLGLLTALSGFEILYAAIERSVLVAGLLAGVTLGIALVGAYLMIAPQMEEAE